MTRVNSSAPAEAPRSGSADDLATTDTTPASREPANANHEPVGASSVEAEGVIEQELAAERIDQVSDGDPV